MSFCATVHVKACRTRHRCFWCNEHVLPGQPAVRISGTGPEGDVGSNYYHPECHAAFESMTDDERRGHGLDDPDECCDPGSFKRGTKECVC